MGRLAYSTPVEIGGKSHRLLLDLNAIVAFETTTKQPFLQFVNTLGDKTSFTDLRALIWAALLHEHDPELSTPDQVGSAIQLDELVPLLALLTTTVRNSLPTAEGLDPNLPSPSIGSPSGPSDGSTLDSVMKTSGI